MRKIVFLSGGFSISLFVLGMVFKTLHLPFGGYTLLISMLLFALVFVPSFAWYYYSRK